MFTRVLSCFAALTLVAPAVCARSLRSFRVPQATAPAAGDCRFEFEHRFVAQRKATDRAGQFFEHGAGYECQVLDYGEVGLEAGLDYVEAHDIRATNALAPLQGNFRATYGARSARGWGAAFGFDDVGFKTGQNNFNVAYLLVQHEVELWRVALGGYTGNGDVLRAPSGQREPTGALFGAWRRIGRGEAGFEWQSGRNRIGYATFGALVRFDERLTAALAYAIANDGGLMRDWALIRLHLR